MAWLLGVLHKPWRKVHNILYLHQRAAGRLPKQALCPKGWFLAKVRETGWFGGFAIFSRTRAGRRGRAIIEEKPPHSPRPGCHPYGITNFGQEPIYGSNDNYTLECYQSALVSRQILSQTRIPPALRRKSHFVYE